MSRTWITIALLSLAAHGGCQPPPPQPSDLGPQENDGRLAACQSRIEALEAQVAELQGHLTRSQQRLADAEAANEQLRIQVELARRTRDEALDQVRKLLARIKVLSENGDASSAGQ